MMIMIATCLRLPSKSATATPGDYLKCASPPVRICITFLFCADSSEPLSPSPSLWRLTRTSVPFPPVCLSATHECHEDADR